MNLNFFRLKIFQENLPPTKLPFFECYHRREFHQNSIESIPVLNSYREMHITNSTAFATHFAYSD